MNFLLPSKPAPPPVVNGVANDGIQSLPVQTVTTSVQTITPELAKKYLSRRNSGNRNLSAAAIAKYAEDMRFGRWHLTGQPIVFDSNGRLVDGHHRLTAAAENNLTFTTLVVFGVLPQTVEAFDLVRPRSSADVAHMNGVTNARQICAIANLILIHERHGIQYMASSAKHPTKIEVSKAAVEYPDLQIALMRARGIKRWVPPAVGGFCYWAMRQVDRAKADQFYELLESGEGLRKGNPVLALRNRLINNKTGRARLDDIYIVALMFKAWSAFRHGRTINELRWRSAGESAEEFPEVGA